MTIVDILGLVVLLLFAALLVLFGVFGSRWPVLFRRIRAFEGLEKEMERSVETGNRVHLSLGTGSVIGSDSAPAFVGLSILNRIARTTALSDRPVLVTTGDGAMSILARDTLRTSYSEIGAGGNYEPTLARFLGPTPYAYIAGIPVLLNTESVALHVLNGAFGNEGALAAGFGEREGLYVIAGTEDVQSQALIFATAGYPLIGEETFAGGAYLGVGGLHKASLRTQDFIRFLIIVIILIGVILSTLGILQ
jgi:hypothetical protein